MSENELLRQNLAILNDSIKKKEIFKIHYDDLLF